MKVQLALVLIAAVAGGCAPKTPPADSVRTNEKPVANVTVETARVENVPIYTTIPGSVVPVRRATVSSKVTGVIDSLRVAPGSRVARGELLVSISALELQARVDQAESQVNRVRRDLERERLLLAQNASTRRMVDDMEDQLAQSEAALREARTMVGYSRITAPFAGVVSRKLADTGDLAAPGAPLLELESEAEFEISCGLPVSMAGQLSIGSPVRIEMPGAGVEFEGLVSELSPTADTFARTVPARIAVPEAVTEIRSGQFVRVHIPGPPKAAILIPASAVSKIGQIERVFVVENERAVLRIVKTGAKRGDRMEVLSGIFDGDLVVVEPFPALREGRRVAAGP